MNRSLEYVVVPIYNIMHKYKVSYDAANQSWLRRKQHPFHAEQLQYDHIFTDGQRRRGAVLLHIVICFYTFFALAILCENYFCTSLEKLCERVKIPGDIAGATFMAAGSSMPTLFICIISLFLGESAIGLGTIIGSTLFNILFIAAATALLAAEVLELHKWPLLRDSFAYSLHLLALLLIIADNRIHWYEGLSVLFLYIIYILSLIYDVELHSLSLQLVGKYQKVRMLKEKEDKSTITSKAQTPDAPYHSENATGEEPMLVVANQQEIQGDKNLEAVNKILEKDQTRYSEFVSRNRKELGFFEEKKEHKHPFDGCGATVNEDDETKGKDNLSSNQHPFLLPNGWTKRIFWGFLLPIRILFFVTMPDIRKERWQQWYPATFLISIVWMAVISYVLVWAVAIIGETLRFPEALMGLFLLAAGSSVPDAIASVVVARRGDGDMAIASCVGSNIFDIVCLSIPWIIATTIIHPNSVIVIEGEHMILTSLTLFGSILACLLIIHTNKWRLTKRTGVTFFLVYVLFMLVCAAIELMPCHSLNPTKADTGNASDNTNKNYTMISGHINETDLISRTLQRHRINYMVGNRTKQL